MKTIAKIILSIAAGFMASLGLLGLVLFAVAFRSLSPQSAFHYFVIIATIFTASFGIGSFVYYPFGDDPFRQILVLVCAFTFFALHAILQIPGARSFLH
jgi:predicted membrane-bound spermidine synthase